MHEGKNAVSAYGIIDLLMLRLNKCPEAQLMSPAREMP
jgi:hypothetical protein